MKVFDFLSQKTIKVQENFDGFYLSQTINMEGKKKSTSKAQKRSLYVKMFCLFSAKVKK